jgi:hypothetical protein
MIFTTADETPQAGGKKRRGCLIFLIVAAAVLLILLVTLFLAGPKLMQYGVDKVIDSVESKVLTQLPEEYDRADVQQTFDRVRDAVKSGKLKGADASQKIQEISLTARGALSDDNLTKEEIDKLMTQIKELLAVIEH